MEINEDDYADETAEKPEDAYRSRLLYEMGLPHWHENEKAMLKLALKWFDQMVYRKDKK